MSNSSSISEASGAVGSTRDAASDSQLWAPSNFYSLLCPEADPWAKFKTSAFFSFPSCFG